MHRLRGVVSVLALQLVACAPDPLDSELDDEDLHESGSFEQALSARERTVDHGPWTLGYGMGLELSDQTSVHRFSFQLPAPATVAIETRPTPPGSSVDTVVSVYRRGRAGQLRLVAQNDDRQGSRFSQLERTLRAGQYVLDVRGFARSTRGPFEFQTTCTGAGCPAEPPACVFGSVFADLRTNPRLKVDDEAWIRSPGGLDSAIEREQFVVAVQQSSHDDVQTVEQGFERIDQNEVRRMYLTDTQTAQTFTVFEYGAGDNSYGAIFSSANTAVMASIHDGDLLSCTLLEA